MNKHPCALDTTSCSAFWDKSIVQRQQDAAVAAVRHRRERETIELSWDSRDKDKEFITLYTIKNIKLLLFSVSYRRKLNIIGVELLLWQHRTFKNCQMKRHVGTPEADVWTTQCVSALPISMTIWTLCLPSIPSRSIGLANIPTAPEHRSAQWEAEQTTDRNELLTQRPRVPGSVHNHKHDPAERNHTSTAGSVVRPEGHNQLI